MVRDSISELANGLKSASIAGKSSMVVRDSKLVYAVLVALEKEGFVQNITRKGKKVQKWIELDLNPEKKIIGAKRISTFSKRIYKGSKEMLANSRIAGVYILTTPQGVMSHKEAKKQNVGGEVLFKMW
jgi:small subunit ribosomal protein S8